MIENNYITELRTLMVTAMKEKDSRKCSVYKTIIAELQNALTKEKEPIAPDNNSCNRFVCKLYNDRKKDAKLAIKNNRQDIANMNLYEAKITASILPPFPTKEAVAEYVKSLGTKNMKVAIDSCKEHFIAYDNDELMEAIKSSING